MLLRAVPLLLIACSAEAARILVLLPFPGKSHFNAFSNLLEDLAKRGHEMTVVSAYPRKEPLVNYKDIVIDDYLRQSNDVNFFEQTEVNNFAFMFFVSSLTLQNCDRFLTYPQVQNLIHTEQNFDLILFEVFFSECVYGFIHKFKAPFIQISSNTITVWMGDGVGNPYFFSYNPELMLDYTDHMTFTERLYNSFFETYLVLFRNWYILPRMEAIMRNHFRDPALPSIREIETNASFLLLNSHIALNYPRPFTPNTAEVGGMHIEEPKKLPEDLKKFLDDAPNGVIYFSLGSHIRSSQMPEAIRNQILKAFSQLKQKVLWKWEADALPGQPKNVRIGKWLPQNDILAHPNVKLFITHGGLLSTQEATYHGMPLVAIPVMGDQKVNARRAQNLGYAAVLDLHNITSESVLEAVNEVLSIPSYAENAKRLSRILRDRPQKPLETAVFWVEYVIRHKGALHMRSAAVELNFFQYYLLDVIAVILLCALTAFVIIVLSCQTVCRCFFSGKGKTKHVSRSKKEK